MRTHINSPEILELRDGISTQRVTCAVMLVLGLTLFGMQFLPDAEPSLVAYVLGAVMAISGAAGIALFRSARLRVDMTSGHVVIGSERMLGRRARQLPVGEIVDITVEESIDADGDGAFRVTFVLRDGRRFPLTSGYSPHHTRAVALAELIRAQVLAQPAAPALPLPLPRGRVPTAKALRLERYLIVVMLLVAAVFVAAGVHLASEEQRSLRQFSLVTVTVEGVRVESRLGDNGETMRRASVTYSYQVEGISYRSDRVTPLDEWRQGGWASEIAQRFTPGRQYEGYYDPRDPSQAYLLRRRNAVPLVLIAIPLFGVLALSSAGLQPPLRLAGRTAP